MYSIDIGVESFQFKPVGGPRVWRRAFHLTDADAGSRMTRLYMYIYIYIILQINILGHR